MGEEEERDALQEALQVGRGAADRGFDWLDERGPLEKIREELGELEEALREDESPERLREEVGDILFSVVNLARHLEVDPGEALGQTTAKFQARFELVQGWAGLKEGGEVGPGLEELEALWKRAKGIVG